MVDNDKCMSPLCRFAARLIAGVLDFKQMIDTWVCLKRKQTVVTDKSLCHWCIKNNKWMICGAVSQWHPACGVPEWEAAVYGSVLPDIVLLSCPRPKERHCCKPHPRENPSISHHCGPQLPGTLDGRWSSYAHYVIIIGAVVKEILSLWLHDPDIAIVSLSSLFWTFTTAMARHWQSTRSTCSWRRSGTRLCKLTKSRLASLRHSTATLGAKPTTTWSRVSRGGVTASCYQTWTLEQQENVWNILTRRLSAGGRTLCINHFQHIDTHIGPRHYELSNLVFPIQHFCWHLLCAWLLFSIRRYLDSCIFSLSLCLMGSHFPFILLGDKHKTFLKMFRAPNSKMYAPDIQPVSEKCAKFRACLKAALVSARLIF